MTKCNVFCYSPQGYSVHLELSGEKVYGDMLLLLDRLATDGFLPRPYPAGSVGHAGGSNGHEGVSTPPAHWCQLHEQEYLQYQKDGKSWWSNKTPSGEWCREGKHA